MPSTKNHAAEIMGRCDVLATFSMDEGRITRPYGTTALVGARGQLATWMQEAGLSTHVDNVGNLFGHYGADPDVAEPKLFLIGGHFDSVVDAGRYDGILGVLAGIAAVQHLHDTNERLPFDVDVVAFADEEGNRFHTTFLGSSPVAGQWDASWLELKDDDDVTLRQAIEAGGGDPDALGSDALDPESLLGFIEVHIEQGPILQERNLPVAAVESITGSSRASIEFGGMAGHAGTVPMTLRKDALVGAAEFVLAVEAVGSSVPNLVATVGKLDVAPGASNVIAGNAEVSLDLRHPDGDLRSRATGELRARAADIAKRRGLDLQWTDMPSFHETPCDPALTGLLREAILAEGIEPIALFSGAGHDAITISRIAPVTMMFVRCKDGISHNPAELIVESDVEVAMRVLNRFLRTCPAQR